MTTLEAYDQMLAQVRSGSLKPIYFLMGEESFYIDLLAENLVEAALKPEERDFALTSVYASDTSIDEILSRAQTFPLGAPRQVILVKEAQQLKRLERLEFYLQHPQPTTVLVFCYKHGVLDRRLKVTSMISKVGALFESKKLYDRELPGFVTAYLKGKGIFAQEGVAQMLAEYVGADLHRLRGEMDKLILAAGSGRIGLDSVRAHIGVSKRFNVFELQEALCRKNGAKAFAIIKYFEENPKENPLQMVLPSLFRFFTNLLLAFHAPENSERGLAKWLGMSDWQVRRNVMPALRLYSEQKVRSILSAVRRTDARSKGVDNSSVSNGELMKELLFFVLH